MPTFRILLLSGFFLLFTGSCKKDETPDPPESPAFELTFHNTYPLPEVEYAVFLSDAEGLVRAFRWLPGGDTARVAVPDAKTGEAFDCTVVGITTLSIPGTGIFDTTVVLTTYTNLSDGTDLHLRSPEFVQTTDLYVTLTNFSTLDAVVVPDGLTFAQPQAANNYVGQYRILHSGRFWLRLRINGESEWRYVLFDAANTPTVNATLDAATLPKLASTPASVGLPFFAPWSCRIDRVIDAGQQQFLAIGGNIPIPGGPVPIFDQLDVFEPPNPSTGTYRLRLNGTDVEPGSYTYLCDRLVSPLPASIPAPAFDIQPTTVTGPRVIAVKCTGAFDLLSLIRTQSGSTNFRWEVLTAPAGNNGIVTYRLPDVPKDLSIRFPRLKSYDYFGPSVRVRAENYDQFNDYPAALAPRLLLNDPLWQMKAGYVGRERVF
ncbi:MAG: hypothetical protein L6Q97_04915 [Thermoanaerobaculia bacterium]|nr:hypothetical protein [Thermoanaerobaculia bacterium]